MKKTLKRVLVLLIAIAFVVPIIPVFALDEPIELEEIRITGELVLEELEEGPLPEYTVQTTTEHISIEDYGSNTNWAQLKQGSDNWSGFGTDDPTAVADGTFYAMRLAIHADEGYVLTENTKIYYNGRDMYDTYTAITPFSWGGYVYVDFAEVRSQDDPAGDDPTDEPDNQKEYVVTSEDEMVTATFTFSEGYDFELSIIDILSLPPEVLEEIFDVPADVFAEGIEIIKEGLKDQGDLLHLYAIEINGPQFNYTDAVTLRFKMTPEMENYNTLKFLFLDESNNFSVQETHDAKIEEIDGEKYVVVELDHLSAYAFVGTNVETNTSTNTDTNNNPGTGDNIVFYISMLTLCTLGLVGVGIYAKKKHYFKTVKQD